MLRSNIYPLKIQILYLLEVREAKAEGKKFVLLISLVRKEVCSVEPFMLEHICSLLTMY